MLYLDRIRDIYGEIQIRYIDQISSSLIPLLMLICDNLLVISSFVLVRAFSLRFSYAEVEYICNFWVFFPLMIPSSTLSLSLDLSPSISRSLSSVFLIRIRTPLNLHGTSIVVPPENSSRFEMHELL